MGLPYNRPCWMRMESRMTLSAGHFYGRAWSRGFCLPDRGSESSVYKEHFDNRIVLTVPTQEDQGKITQRKEKHMKDKYIQTAESVTEGHPDKICDQISDAIVDAIMAEDPQGRVAAETTVNTGYAMIMGEISTRCYIDIQKLREK
mgnify:CR=1 FL=1